VPESLTYTLPDPRHDASEQVILHLSDIHFVEYEQPIPRAARRLALTNLENTLRDLEDEWHPRIVCITGDVATHAKPDAYDKAATWLSGFIQRMGIAPENVVLCPGNHDVDLSLTSDRNRLIDESPDQNGMNLLSEIPLPSYLTIPFERYAQFCEQLQIPRYLLEDGENYLWGYRMIDGIVFVGCNSAWLSKGGSDIDRGHLAFGLGLLQYVFASDQLIENDLGSSSHVVVALCHHTSEYLLECERVPHEIAAAWAFLGHRADLVLTGHTHGAPQPNEMLPGGCWHLTAGSTYSGIKDFNNCKLIRVGPLGFEYRVFEKDPRSSSPSWRQVHQDRLRYKYLNPAFDALCDLYGSAGRSISITTNNLPRTERVSLTPEASSPQAGVGATALETARTMHREIDTLFISGKYDEASADCDRLQSLLESYSLTSGPEVAAIYDLLTQVELAWQRQRSDETGRHIDTAKARMLIERAKNAING
jgi:predicted MPP superfamily phosphohydrolase